MTRRECWHRWNTTVDGNAITKVCRYCGQRLRFTYPDGEFPLHVRRYLADESC